jgi:hypothetical protein
MAGNILKNDDGKITLQPLPLACDSLKSEPQHIEQGTLNFEVFPSTFAD